MGNPADATRLDPYGEMGHVKAINLGEAARLLREATEGQQQAATALLHAKRAVTAKEAEKVAADTKLSEAMYCLQLSALKIWVYVPIEPKDDYKSFGVTRIAREDATPAQLLIIEQMNAYRESLGTASPISEETLHSQLKEFFEGK